ncbi:hypothetical protein J7J62_08125 [bacterium]|nr:hypothetical protein [bacterium]
MAKGGNSIGIIIYKDEEEITVQFNFDRTIRLPKPIKLHWLKGFGIFNVGFLEGKPWSDDDYLLLKGKPICSEKDIKLFLEDLKILLYTWIKFFTQ